MNRKSLFLLLFLAVLSLTSCDWVRMRLDLPTKKESRERLEKNHQENDLEDVYLFEEREESQFIEEPIFDPSMSGDDELNASSLYNKPLGTSGASSTPNVKPTPGYTPAKATTSMNRFHVVVGSFRMAENASRMVKLLAEYGYHPEELLFKNGYMVVSAGSFPTHSDAQAARRRIQSNDGRILPYDTYIYDMNEKRHIER